MDSLITAAAHALAAGDPLGALKRIALHACLVLNTPAARLMANGEERPLRLEEVEALLAASVFVVDVPSCRA